MSEQARINETARMRALEAMSRISVEATSLVNYESKGRALIIGDNQALEVAPRLNQALDTWVVLTEGTEEPGVPLVPLGGRSLKVEGYLGQFRIQLGEPGSLNAESLSADMILDLSPEPLIESEIKPPGYIHASLEEPELQGAMQQLSELKGRFEKPRFFDYNPDICAHGHAGKQACTRCIDACPADAISSIGETIEVNAHLCQWGGVCASVCPSGAMRYSYPSARDNLERLRCLLRVYREEGGVDPVLLLLAESEQSAIQPQASNQLPFILEELASAGLEFWLSALAYGAQGVLLVDGGVMPEASKAALQQQLGYTGEILTALGYDAAAVSLLEADRLPEIDPAPMPQREWAGFSGIGGKRQTAYLAIDHLYKNAQRAKPMVSLSVGAPFGTAHVEAGACTLCFSCVSACPGKALQTGGEGIPQLNFIEENCLQCGLCTRTCPEDAIWITPRLLFDGEARRRKRKLHEEQPFLCTACGKPFATQSVIQTMLNKLQGHHMFQSERARRRLTLCEDCRVVDIVQDQEAMERGLNDPMRQ